MSRALGNTLSLGTLPDGSPFQLSADDRNRHLYIAGATRAGKSKMIETCIRQDIKQWRRTKCPLIFIDRHGSSYDDLVAWLAWNADKLPKDFPLILIDPRQEGVVGYNVIRKRQAETAVVVGNFVQAIAHAFGQSGTTETPLFAEVAGNVLWVLYELDLTLAEAIYLTDFEKRFLREALLEAVRNPHVRSDWRRYHRGSAAAFDDNFGSTIRRLRAFCAHDRFNLMFGQKEASLDWRMVLDEGAVVLVNLSEEAGRLSEEHAAVLGSTMLHDLWLAAKERGPRKGMPPAYIYLDEFQEFVSPTLAKSLAQASKFGLHLTMSHQFPTQLKNAGPHGKAVYDEVLGNAQNKCVFHTEHPDDLPLLARILFLGVFDTNKIKLAIETTKVMNYREVTRKSYVHGTSDADRDSDHWGDADSRTTPLSGEGGSSSFASNRSGSRDRSRTTMESVSQSTVPEPVMGKEISGVHFESLEEQLHHAMVALKDQEQRQFVAKRHNLRVPVTLRTPTVLDAPSSEKRIASYVEQVRKRWDFILPVETAQQRIDARQKELEQRFAFPKTDEPTSAKRKILR